MKLELQISINRNIVECKDFRNISVCQLIFVLIETLWNVKMDINEANFIPTAVLIETLWNVKSVNPLCCFISLRRINRNIVECKDIFLENFEGIICVLIETLWNVKKNESAKLKMQVMVLIETLWNVKSGLL